MMMFYKHLREIDVPEMMVVEAELLFHAAIPRIDGRLRCYQNLSKWTRHAESE